MELSEAIKLRINNLLKEQNIKKYELCIKSGISFSTLSSFMNKYYALPKLDTLLHICEGFGLTLSQFFDDKIFKDVERD